VELLPLLWVGDEDNIHTVLSGLSGRDALRGMLARLTPKEEVLLLGRGVPMPLPAEGSRGGMMMHSERSCRST
jgi:hypothetical protein